MAAILKLTEGREAVNPASETSTAIGSVTTSQMEIGIRRSEKFKKLTKVCRRGSAGLIDEQQESSPAVLAGISRIAVLLLVDGLQIRYSRFAPVLRSRQAVGTARG